MTKKTLFFRVFLGLLCTLALYGQAEQVTPQPPSDEVIRGFNLEVNRLRSDLNQALKGIDSKNEAERQRLKEQLEANYLGRIAAAESNQREAEAAKESSERQARIDREAAQKRLRRYYWVLSGVTVLILGGSLFAFRTFRRRNARLAPPVVLMKAETTATDVLMDPTADEVRQHCKKHGLTKVEIAIPLKQEDVVIYATAEYRGEQDLPIVWFVGRAKPATWKNRYSVAAEVLATKRGVAS